MYVGTALVRSQSFLDKWWLAVCILSAKRWTTGWSALHERSGVTIFFNFAFFINQLLVVLWDKSRKGLEFCQMFLEKILIQIRRVFVVYHRKVMSPWCMYTPLRVEIPSEMTTTEEFKPIPHGDCTEESIMKMNNSVQIRLIPSPL